MTKEITFILPTLNRKKLVQRAITSCLRCENELVQSYVLVIDGESEDGTFEELQSKYKDNKRVKIIQYDRTAGFQKTAYWGVSHVKTEYVTFMYDDDLLSPYYIDMISHMISTNKNFIMGYGHQYDATKRYPFKSIKQYLECSKRQLILAYFSYWGSIKYLGLPVSPICCVTMTDHLKEWVGFSKKFAQKTKLRKHFMLDLNIGPDLIIYLSAILQEKNNVVIAPTIVAQLSYHEDSMSIGYGNPPLVIGYWVSKIWAFEELCKREDMLQEASLCGAYLFLSGLKNAIQNLAGNQSKWVFSILKETFQILISAAKNKIFFSLLCSCFTFISTNLRLKRKYIVIKPN